MRIVASAPPTPFPLLATVRQAPRTKFVNVGCTRRVHSDGASRRARYASDPRTSIVRAS